MRRLIREVTSFTEYAELAGQWSALDDLPDGDGHEVVVVPGLMASNASTALLRRFLRRRNYDADGWSLGRNRGSVAQFDAFIDEVDGRARRARAPISLLGWSLGGIASRWAAHHAPQSVRQVITIGSPFRVDPRQMSIFPLYQAVGGVRPEDFTDERLDAIRATPVMPTTSVVSTDDVVAPPASGHQPAGPTSETVEVTGSHSGLIRNPAVWRIVADRLAQPAGTWQPFVSERPVPDPHPSPAQPA